MGDVWKSTIEDATRVAVLLVLANYADDEGGNCFPGTERIARMTRFSKSTVKRALAGLEKQGWITIVDRGLGKGNLSSYEIDVAKLKRCQADPFFYPRKKGSLRKPKGFTGALKGFTGDNPPNPLFGVTVSYPSKQPNPLPPARQGDAPVATRIAAALETACTDLGVDEPRMRKLLHRVITRKALDGEDAGEVAALIVRRWNRQAELSPFLRVKFGLRKFIGLGYWENENRWHFDEEKWRLHNEARTGSNWL